MIGGLKFTLQSFSYIDYAYYNGCKVRKTQN